MGDYTAMSFSLKFKEDADEDVIAIMRDYLILTYNDFLKKYVVDEKDTEEQMVYFERAMQLFYGGSSYFETWDNVQTFKKDPEDNCWVFFTKTSRKHCPIEFVKSFIQSLLPHLKVEEGTILFRSVYECAEKETIVYYSNGGLVVGDGYWYVSEYDCQHPRSQKGSDDFDPPMLYADLMAAVKSKQDKHTREEYKGGFS